MVLSLDLLTLLFTLIQRFYYWLLNNPQEIERRNSDAEEGGKIERPEEVLLGDKPLLFNVVIWLVVTFTILLTHQQGLI
jgi:decaprenyl-phosphate phosphoribosyltransferase